LEQKLGEMNNVHVEVEKNTNDAVVWQLRIRPSL